MDDLIIEIYRIIAEKQGRNETSIKLESIINELTETAYRNNMKNHKDHLNTIIADAVCIGQDDGFITGFKCSIKLLISCLHEK